MAAPSESPTHIFAKVNPQPPPDLLAPPSPSLRFPKKPLVCCPSASKPRRIFREGAANIPLVRMVTTYRSSLLRPSFPAPPGFVRLCVFRECFASSCSAVATPPPAITLRLILRGGNNLRCPSTPHPRLHPILPPQLLRNSSAAHHLPAFPPDLSPCDFRKKELPGYTPAHIDPRGVCATNFSTQTPRLDFCGRTVNPPQYWSR